MNNDVAIAYFTDVIQRTGAFDIENWFYADGTPKKVINYCIKSIFPVQKGVSSQAIYIAGFTRLFMGIMDSTESQQDCDIDLSYNFKNNVLVISFTDKWGDLNGLCMEDIELTEVLYVDESEYFQESTVINLLFTFEQHKTMHDFFKKILKNSQKS